MTTILPENILKLMSPEDRKKLGKAGKTKVEIAVDSEIKAEKDLHKALIGYLNMKGIAVGHARMDRKSSYTEGWPDLTFVVKTKDGLGIPVAFELKGSKGVLSEEQEKVLAQMKENGWSVHIVRTMEEGVKIIQKIKEL
ncbi:MAG: VRR-NUC domain-containing protein [Candidatus Nanoarchaeia archaeon]